jgi:hypothetical protein
MHSKSMLMRFAIIVAAALSLTTLTAVSVWTSTQPALAKISSPTKNNQNLGDKVSVATSATDEVSSRPTLISFEGEDSDHGVVEDENNNIDESLDEASVTNSNDEADQLDEGKQQCREGDVLEGVYDPERLKVLSSCEEAIGIVEDSDIAHDDDLKLFLNVEDAYKNLLNEENDDKTNGQLVVEVIPDDQDSSLIQIPEEGDRVKVVGAWVTDEGAGGWNEIHPAWRVEVLQ